MAPKRKSDVVDLASSEDDVPSTSKKARVSDASVASSSAAQPAMSKKELKEKEKQLGREAELLAFEEEVNSVSLCF